jgi:sugar transferase (PEP-CTERM/EpsH1 system associated)
MKILFACHRFPFPPNRGGKIRPFNMIRHLSQKHEIVVATVAHTQQEFDEGAGLKEYCSCICAEVVPENLRWLQAVRALPSSTPSSVAYFSSAALRQKVKEAALKNSFDTIIVHCAFAAQYVLGIPAKFRMMDFGDLDSGKWLDYSEWRSFPLSWGYYLEGQKLRRYEQTLASSFDYCTLTTQGELEEFKKLNVDRPHSVIPNGVDRNYFRPNGGPSKANPVIVFLGRMDYYPNIDAVLYFTESVFPTIRAAVPSVEFRIIGSNPSPPVQRLREVPGVVVTGQVADVRPYLSDAVVAVAPLRMARGTQNKILESIAMGLPVVATSVAAKGIQVIPNEQLLVGDDPELFAEQVIRVLQDPSLRTTLSDAGYQKVKEAHAWPVSMRTLDNILTSRGFF